MDRFECNNIIISMDIRQEELLSELTLKLND